MVTDISKLPEDMPGIQEQLELFFEGTREIISRTEQYWCPIHQANRVMDVHRRYPQFFAFGDAQGFQQGLVSKRRALKEEHHDRHV